MHSLRLKSRQAYGYIAMPPSGSLLVLLADNFPDFETANFNNYNLQDDPGRSPENSHEGK